VSAAEPSDPADPAAPTDPTGRPAPTDPAPPAGSTDPVGPTGRPGSIADGEPATEAGAETEAAEGGAPEAAAEPGAAAAGAEPGAAAAGADAEAETADAGAAATGAETEAGQGGAAAAAGAETEVEAGEGEAGAETGAGEGGGIRLRRLPQQARSRERVQRLLAAADEVLGNEGFSALTVRRLSEEAGVPVGTIYQFFADKAAVVDALARRYIGEFDEMIELLVADAEAHRWDDVVATVIDAAVAMYRSKPGYVALWTGRHLSPELMQADEANNAAIAAGLRRILVAQHGLVDDDDLARRCEVAVVTTDALLQLAFRRDPRGDEAVLGEARRLQRLYLDDIVAGR
jgi:AcrR family transcriptional regulator